MQIRRLTALRYRSFSSVTWHPSAGINCLVGPGDVGKSSILDAIALALHPAPAGPALEHDYHRRQVDDGFEVKLVVGGLSDDARRAFDPPPLKGWKAGNRELIDAPEVGAEPVLDILVRGTPDLEIEHRVLLPNESERSLPPRVRQALGLCLAGGSRPAYREFRLSKGSLLQRTIGGKELRASAVASLRTASEGLTLPDDAQQEIDRLRQRMNEDGLAPGELALALISPPGQNLLSLLGLAVGASKEAIPLGHHGQGTQRIAAFLLALALTKTEPIITLDEAELGLEPYRQRQLVRKMREVLGDKGQAFVTTHSPAILAELKIDELHRVHRAEDRRNSAVTQFGQALRDLPMRDPDALLSRLPIVVEGPTECGLLEEMLTAKAKSEKRDFLAMGVHLVDGGGQPHAFGVAESLCKSGFSVTAFLDEHGHSGQLQKLADAGVVLGGFGKQSVEHAIAEVLPLEQLDRLLDCPGRDGNDRTARLHQLTDELGKQGRPTFDELITQAGGETEARKLIATVALKKKWFKSRDAGRNLARFLLEQRPLPPQLSSPLTKLWKGLVKCLPNESGQSKNAHDREYPD